jgi:hypothetical protein
LDNPVFFAGGTWLHWVSEGGVGGSDFDIGSGGSSRSTAEAAGPFLDTLGDMSPSIFLVDGAVTAKSGNRADGDIPIAPS